MSRFFVGQRVRVVDECDPQDRPLVGGEIGGKEGTVIRRIPWYEKQPQDIDVDCYDVLIDGIAYVEGYLPGYVLRPLTDPGREVIAWSECLWKPDHLRSRVEVGP